MPGVKEGRTLFGVSYRKPKNDNFLFFFFFANGASSRHETVLLEKVGESKSVGTMQISKNSLTVAGCLREESSNER